MSKVKPVLGRGLASLIPAAEREVIPERSSARADDGVSTGVIAHIELAMVQPNPYQPRADFDPVTLEELRRSIQEKGVIQPVTVRRLEQGYQLISGERRVRAAREAGLAAIPAYIIAVASNEEMLELALIENLQREHLNPIEISISYKRLIDECHYTQEQLADRIGKDRSTVANILRLLKLPVPVQTALRKGQLTNGHARALISIEDPVLQMDIFRRTIDDELSVREVERLVRYKARRRAPRAVPPRPLPDSALAGIEDRLRRQFGTKVEVRPLQDGKGQVVLEYYSADDLERILELLSTAGEPSS
ncbi:MAG: ParB/RepB/Spo0J family partition protein [Bacteroidota bacterium]